MDLFRDLFDGIGRDYPLVRQKAGKQHAIAEQVDAPGDPRARGEDRFERVRHDERHALPADTFEPMLYVGPRVIGVQRTDMARRDHALAQCMQPGGLQNRAKFWLSDHESLALMQPVFDKRHRAPVLPAVEVELRIRVELERLSGESVERFVHGRATFGSTRCRRSRFPDSSRSVSSCRSSRAVRQATPTSLGRAGSRGTRCKTAAESAGWSWSGRRSAMKLPPVSPC